MRLFPTRLAVSALALLSLAACDSGTTDEPSADPDALVGSWSLLESTDETFLTVSEGQPLVDQGGVQTGSVAFSGAESGTLRYIASVPSNGSTEAVLVSYDPRQSTTDPVRYELRLSGTSGYTTLYAFRPNGSSSYYESFGSVPAYTYVNGRVTVRALTLQSFSGTSVSVAAGAIAFPVVQIPAGQRTLVRTTTVAFQEPPYDGIDALRYVFEDDGVYRAERDNFPNVTYSTEGTWETSGDRLRLTVPAFDEGTAETRTYRYAVSDSRLLLDVTAQDCRADAACLRNVEGSFGLRTGTVTGYSVESRATFNPTGDAPARPARTGAPVPVDPRRETAVWPRALARTAADA